MNNAATGYTLITMPAGSIISRVSGSGYRSWVFRVDNGLSGSDREYFDLDYCKIATDAHMLRLKSRIRGDKQPK